MGRYVSSGAAQANLVSTVVASECYQVPTHKYAYDANENWPNRVILDTPGNYTFTVPSGVNCVRTIAVGGGGKSYQTQTCCGYAGAGGAYAETWDTINSGCSINIVVGRQQQDTTISYTNSGATACTITAGGATGCTPGSAAGGCINSTGGAAGKNCSYCGGSYSHYCGSCIYTYATTCCGYCVVWSGVSARTLDPSHDANFCCQARYAGGGSAGSWIWSTGGKGQDAANSAAWVANGYGASAGGGGGIGYIGREEGRNWYCSCICHTSGYNGHLYGVLQRNSYYGGYSGGGGGTKFVCQTACECQTWQGWCQQGRWKNGEGGWGGCCNNEGRPMDFWWGFSSAPNFHNVSWNAEVEPGPAPNKYHWHDIHDMKGSGSSGKSMMTYCRANSSNWISQITDGYHENSGEGAGTGGIQYICCSITTTFGECCIGGANACGTLHWPLICCLGTMNKICCADQMITQIQPYVFACAGTLGGAGGTGICHWTQKAGKGGGAGVSRSAILCICYGGNFDTCNGDGTTPLAFPPSELDWRVSNAGTGMAIIYWKDPD